MLWKCRDREFNLKEKTLVMGIVNVTPDSFSDGTPGNFVNAAIDRAMNQVAAGVDILDIGGESTRPGAVPLQADEELARILPVIRELTKTGITLSIDTYHPETMLAALREGAHIVNCVRPLPSVPEMIDLAVEFEAGLVFHCRSENDLTSLRNFKTPSNHSIAELEKSDTATCLMADPMIGFDTTREEDVTLLREFRKIPAPVLIGVSRKRIIGTLSGESVASKRLGGSVGAAIWSALRGAAVVRVHDVKETVDALRVVEALKRDSN